MLEAYKKSVNDVFKAVKKQNKELNTPLVVELKNIEQGKYTTEHTTEHTTTHLTEQVLTQPHNHTSTQAYNQPHNHTTKHTTTQSSNIKTNHTPTQPINQSTNQPPNLNNKQFEILRYIYFNRPFKVKGKNGLEGILNINYGNVRNSLVSLTKKSYIEKPFMVYNSCFNGSTCRVNEDICFALFGKTNIVQPNNHTTDHTIKQPHNQIFNSATDQPHNRSTTQPNNSYISSSSLIKTTTKLNNYNLPEFKFWIETGVTEKQISGWLEEFEIEEFLMLNFLRYAEFDLVDNKKITNVPNPAGWLYRTLKKNHSYNKPKNFKSYTEKIKEKEQMEFEKEKAEYEKLKKLREDREKLKQDMAFEKMLADPEGELYQKCFGNLSNIFKNRYSKKEKRSGKQYLETLRIQFNKINDEFDDSYLEIQ